MRVIALVFGMGGLLVAGVRWPRRAAEPVVAQRPAILSLNRDAELEQQRNFVRSVADLAASFCPGEILPPKDEERPVGAYGGRSDGWLDSSIYVPRGYDSLVETSISSHFLFERALREAAAERGLTVETARATLRAFVACQHSGQAVELLDAALASFAEQDFAAAEEKVLQAVAKGQRATYVEDSGASGSGLLQVLADAGGALRAWTPRLRRAHLLAGDLQLLQGKFRDAEGSYRAAMQLTAKSDTDRWLEGRRRLGRTLEQRHRHLAALALWQEIAATSAARYGPTERPTFDAQSWIAWELIRLERRAEAEEKLLALHEARERRFGPTDPDVARSLVEIAQLRRAQKSDFDAAPLLLKAAALREQVLPADHPDLLENFRQLVSVNRGRRFPDEARKYARRALAAAEQLFGMDHLEVAQAAVTLGRLLEQSASPETFGEVADGKKEEHLLEAESLYRRALAVRTRQLGPDHEETAATRDGLDGILETLGKPSELVPYLRTRLAARRQKFGEDHAETVAALAELGVELVRHGDHDQGVALLRQAVAACDSRLGDETVAPPTLQDCKTLLQALKSSLSSLEFCVDREVADAEHLFYRLYEAQGEMLKAEVEWQESLHGSADWTVATALERAALYELNADKHSAAEPLLRRVLAIHERQPWRDDGDVELTLSSLGTSAELDGRIDEAVKCYERELASVKERLGAKSPAAVSKLRHLADVLFRKGRPAAAEPLLRQALSIQEELLNRVPREIDRKERAETLQRLAEAVRDQGRLSEAEALFRLAR